MPEGGREVRSRDLVRTLVAALALAVPACTRPGLNAGEDGGLAWIGLTVMLLITGAILWFALGRGE
jgi:hypothetical protein